MPSSKSSGQPAEIGLLLYPGFQSATVHGLTDLLQTASGFSAKRGGPVLRISHWSMLESGEIARSYDNSARREAGAVTIVIPGRLAGPIAREEAVPFARFLMKKHAEGAVLASTCAGAFLLAETGLLAGRPATTHWMFAEAFRSRFPDVKMDSDKMLIEDGDIITAGGLMAWTDLGLRLIDRTLGPTIMIETAQFFLIDPAGRVQKHYSSFAPRLSHCDEAILKVQHWLQSREVAPASVLEMAKEAALEERTFLRRFKAATGMKPTEYSRHLRIGRARELLQFSKRPIDQIAWAVGYEDSASFRKSFHQLVGLSPGEYRRRFRASDAHAAT